MIDIIDVEIMDYDIDVDEIEEEEEEALSPRGFFFGACRDELDMKDDDMNALTFI